MQMQFSRARVCLNQYSVLKIEQEGLTLSELVLGSIEKKTMSLLSSTFGIKGIAEESR